MKIIYIFQVDFVGGAELFALDFLKFAARKSELIAVISENAPKKFVEKIPKNVEKISMNLPRLNLRNLPKIFFTILKLRKIFKKNKNAKIVANTVRTAILTNFAMKFSARKFYFFAHDFTFSKIFLRICEKKFTKIFAVSRAIKNDFLKKFSTKFSREKILKIANPAPQFSTKFEFQKNLKKFRVGIFSRIDRWKGHKIFLRAAQKVLREN